MLQVYLSLYSSRKNRSNTVTIPGNSVNINIDGLTGSDRLEYSENIIDYRQLLFESYHQLTEVILLILTQAAQAQYVRLRNFENDRHYKGFVWGFQKINTSHCYGYFCTCLSLIHSYF